MTLHADAVLGELAKLAEGLVFPSEIDAPVLTIGPFHDATALEIVRRLAPGAPIREGSLDDFFGTLTDPESYFASREPDAHKRFRALAELVEKLDDVTVHYAGDSRATLFVLGRPEPGIWVGLSTDVLET